MQNYAQYSRGHCTVGFVTSSFMIPIPDSTIQAQRKRGKKNFYIGNITIMDPRAHHHNSVKSLVQKIDSDTGAQLDHTD